MKPTVSAIRIFSRFRHLGDTGIMRVLQDSLTGTAAAAKKDP